jgi:hypothetical protein
MTSGALSIGTGDMNCFEFILGVAQQITNSNGVVQIRLYCSRAYTTK